MAVDFRNNTTQEVTEYNAMHTVGLILGYGASRFSKYLRGAQAT